MKAKSNPFLRTLALTSSIVLSFAASAFAADLYWDANGETAGVGGTGNWSSTAWRDGSTTGALGTWVDNNRPTFATTAGIVTLDQNVAADGMNFLVNANEIRGSGSNAITFSGGTVTSGNSGHEITALLAGDVIFNPTAGSLGVTSTFFIKANNTGLTSFQLNAANDNANMIIDDVGALGPAASPVLLTKGILNIGTFTTDAIGSATANGSGGNLSLNAWTTTLAGGTIRSRVGANTWNGPTTLTANSGLMTRGVSDVSLTFSSTATINLDSFTLTCSSDLSSGGIKLQGDITGTGKIATGNFGGGGSINAGGYTVLSGSNDYSGGTDVNYGSLVFQKKASKPSTGTVTVAAGATLGLGVGDSGTYFTGTDIDALFGGTFGATLAATSNVGLDTTAGDFIYAGSSGAVTYGLSKLGANKLTLTGANAYTGPTNVFGGSIALSGSGTFGSGALTLNGGTVDLGGQSINIGALSVVVPAASGETITAGSLTTSGTAANSYAVSNASGNAVIAASLLANSTAGLTKSGAGTLTLSGSNTYTGGTTVSAGNITFLKAASLPATGTVTVPATATVGLGVGASPTYFTGTDVLSLLAGTLTNVDGTNAYTVGINTAAGDFDLTNDIGTSTRAIVKQGANALTLSGNNSFDKLITVSEGTLKAGSATAFNNTGSLAVLPGATFDLNGFDAKFVSMTSNTGTVTTTGAGSGTDTLTISASNVDGVGNLFTDNGTRKLKLDFTSATGAARQATNNVNNTYSGGLILGNIMRVQVPAGTVGTPGAIVSGGLGRGTITINGGASNTTGAQIWFSTSNRTLVNDVIVNGNAGNGSRGGSFRVTYPGSVISGNIDANAVDAHFGADGAVGTSLALTGKLTGLKGFRFFNSSGSNAWTATLNNATASPNDYAGNTTVDNSSVTLVLGAANQIPNGDGKGNVAVNYGKLDLAGYDETINGLSSGSTTTGVIDNLTAANATNTLTIGDGDATGLTFYGVIKNTTGTLSIIKTGGGTQTLAGANEYSGTTTISDGTLLVNGNQSLATGNVQVDGTLGGNGTLGGAVTVGATGIIAPGTSTGVLTVPSANLSAGGTLVIEINDLSTPKVDKLVVTGALDVTDAKLDFNVTGTPAETSYVIATAGSITGTIAPGNVSNLPDGYKVVQTSTEIRLDLDSGSDYDDWAATFSPPAGIATADDDGDGLTNFEEYAFGLNPKSGSSVNPITQQLDKGAGTFKYTRRATPATTGVSYTVSSSTTLATGGWTDLVKDTDYTESVSTSGAIETVTITLTPAPTAAKLFIQVKAAK